MKKGTVKVRGIRSPVPPGHMLGRTDVGTGDAHLIRAGRALTLGNRRLDVTLSGDVEIDQKGDATVVGLQGVPIDDTAPIAGEFLTFDGSNWVPGSGGSGSGDVIGPASAVADHVVTFNGTSGKAIKDSGLTLSGTNTGDQTITLTGNVTGSGTGSFAATIANSAVTLAKIANASANSKLLGSGASGSGAPYAEITLGTNLSMSGTTLNATGGGGGGTGDVVGPGSAVDGHVVLFDGTTGKLIKDSGAALPAAYTDEQAQDAVGAMVDASLTYVDATPSLGLAANQKIAAIPFIIDGGGAVITTGYKGHIVCEFAGTITQNTLLGEGSGSIVVDIWKTTYSAFDGASSHPASGDKITASAPPTISGATKSQDATLTGWTTSFSAGDILGFNVNSITTFQRVTLSLKVTKT